MCDGVRLKRLKVWPVKAGAEGVAPALVVGDSIGVGFPAYEYNSILTYQLTHVLTHREDSLLSYPRATIPES